MPLTTLQKRGYLQTVMSCLAYNIVAIASHVNEIAQMKKYTVNLCCT